MVDGPYEGLGHAQIGRDLLRSVAARVRRVDLAPVRRHQAAVAVRMVGAAHLPVVMDWVEGEAASRVYGQV